MTPDSRNGRPVGGDRTTSRIPNLQNTPQGHDLASVRDQIEWWTSPALAYWAGLVDGAQLAREQLEAEDDRAHRKAVADIVRFVEVADRRAAYDRARPRD